MKVRIELEEGRQEDEVVIRCHSLTDEIRQIHNAISSVTSSKQNVVLYKEDTEYYVALEDILFFETESNGLNVHTRDNVYQAKYRLYELEEMLPGYFLRISKSTILNVREVYSLSRNNLSTTSVAAFRASHKQVFVSRHYVKMLKEKLEEMRMR
ncbi:MAG: LytTR family transcriptional regulator [Lachnospiraceae bacterium]|nr:LytTR family transcriptional regulator [Lachnospiraceae bacterium]